MVEAKRVLVVGATGYLGLHVLDDACRSGYRVRALVRNPKKLEGRRANLESVVVAEVTSPDSLCGKLEGVDVVFSSLGITRQKDGLRYLDVDYQGNLNVLREAERAGCKKFVYVSVLHPEYTIHTDMVAAKELFVAALQKSPLETTVVRPTGFFSDMGEFLQMAKSGRCYVFGDGSSKLNPIHGADLARRCVACFDTRVAEVPIGGPEVLSQRQIAGYAFEALGTKAKLLGVPFWLMDCLLWICKPLSRRWWNILAFMSSASRHDMVAPAYGERRLKAWFVEQLAE